MNHLSNDSRTWNFIERRVLPRGNRTAFTLVELMVVIAIIGILVGLTLPAVQSVRRSAMRTECANNLRQQGIALHNFHSSNHHYPLGADFETGHSWASHILPFIELETLHTGLNFGLPWDEENNSKIAFKTIPVFSCPISIKDYDGKTDYCGIAGSAASGKNMDLSGQNGVLIIATKEEQRPVSNSGISDGLSQTIMVAEGVAVQEENFGYWACGWHCFTHEDGGVNNLQGGYNEIASLHTKGAHAFFADGSLRFLSDTLDPAVLWGMCTRHGGEMAKQFSP